MWKVKAISGNIFNIEQEKSELLLFLNPPVNDSSISKFTDHICESLSQRIGPFHIQYGFVGQNGTKPFIFANWNTQVSSFLEVRWYFSSFMKRLKSQLQINKLAILLDGKSQWINQSFVLAEDIYTSFLRPLDQNLNYVDEIKLYVNSENSELYSQRFAHRLAYMKWVNENPDDLTSIEMGRRLEDFARQHDCEFHAYQEDQLKHLGLNLLVAVGQASEKSPSRLFILSKNLQPNKKPLMLVGKGITFDTGGVNVKPFASHVNAMKNDMGGAALMSQTFMSLIQGGYSDPIVLVIPACENLVAQKAMKPGSVIRSHRGFDVLIDHTDAEGRLILADAISFAQKNYSPKLTICAATLTTAALRQYTNFYTPVHFAHDALQESLLERSKVNGEKFVFCEEFAPFYAANSARIGDLTNMGRMPSHASIGGGSNVAAHFLRKFSTGPFVHIDIFASAWNWSADYPGTVSGATGAVFNSLVDSLRFDMNL